MKKRRNRMKNRRIKENTFNNFDDININIANLTALEVMLYRAKDREWYILPRSTHWVQHIFASSDHFSDGQFKTTFRMNRRSFYSLLNILQPYIQKSTTRFREPLPPEHRLAIFLYHIALGASYLSLSNQFGCGKSTVSSIIVEVAQAIFNHMTKRYIRFPTTEEAIRTMEFWRTKSGIPGVVACIDGSHIPIQQPSQGGRGYFNRKSFYSLNIQGTSGIF
jgi:hypothetical protein